MAIEKRTEKGDARRLDILSRLRDKARKFKNLERLKNDSGWPALKAILEDSIKAQEGRIRFLLTQDCLEEYNHSEARKAEALRGHNESIIDAVENPEKAQGDISAQIKALEEQMKEAQEA